MNNKDEKIRKALIRFHKSTIDIDGIKGKDIINWLEDRHDTITKTIEWLDEHLIEYWGQQNSDPSEFLVKLKKVMEDE